MQVKEGRSCSYNNYNKIILLITRCIDGKKKLILFEKIPLKIMNNLKEGRKLIRSEMRMCWSEN